MLQFCLLYFEVVLGAECGDVVVPLIHPLAIGDSGTPGRVRVGFIHIWGVEGTTFNPGEGTPGSRAEERVLLISRIFSETHIDGSLGKTGEQSP